MRRYGSKCCVLYLSAWKGGPRWVGVRHKIGLIKGNRQNIQKLLCVKLQEGTEVRV